MSSLHKEEKIKIKVYLSLHISSFWSSHIQCIKAADELQAAVFLL